MSALAITTSSPPKRSGAAVNDRVERLAVGDVDPNCQYAVAAELENECVEDLLAPADQYDIGTRGRGAPWRWPC